MNEENGHTAENPTPTPEIKVPGQPPAPVQSSGGLGLAIASLVLGILAILLSLILVGGALGVVGLILGIVHLNSRRGSRGMAGWGVGLSVIGLLASIGVGVLYYQALKGIEKSRGGLESGLSANEWQGVAAPDLTVSTLDGKQLALSDLKGKRVVLDFWATWCPPCRMEIPHFIQLAKEVSADELRIVGISREDPETLQEFAENEDINYTLALAENLPAPYAQVRSIPTTFFIDRNGIIQTIVVGYHDYETLKGYAMDEDWVGDPKPTPTPLPDAEAPVPGV